MSLSISRTRFAVFALVVTIFSFAHGAAAAETSKPVFLYSRYFNAKGENRYPPDGQYKDVLERLRKDFDVRVNDLPLNADTLKNVAVVLISNPNDKAAGKNPPPPHVSAADVAELTKYLEAGGGLIVMGNQENHNLEINDFNKLLTVFGMKFESRYTDAKRLVLPKDAPIIGGLSWAYYTGNQIVLDSGNPNHPRAVVTNDLNQKPEAGKKRDEPGVLLAVAKPGKGHVVVVTDAGWITNDALSGKGIGGVAIKAQDNWEIMLRLTKWAVGEK